MVVSKAGRVTGRLTDCWAVVELEYKLDCLTVITSSWHIYFDWKSVFCFFFSKSTLYMVFFSAILDRGYGLLSSLFILLFVINSFIFSREERRPSSIWGALHSRGNMDGMSSYQSGGGHSQELQKYSHSIGTNIQKISQNGKGQGLTFLIIFVIADFHLICIQ